MKFVPLCLASLLACLVACSPAVSPSPSDSPSSVSYPTTGLTFSHDPTLIQSGNRWWQYFTGSGVQVRISTDGGAWLPGRSVFPVEKAWWRTYAPQMGTNDVWAPDVSYSKGRYWLYYAVSEFGKRNSAIGLASCTDLALGDWRDDGLVISSSNATAYNAIDPALVVDAGGGTWLSFGSWSGGIYLVALDAETRKPSGTPVKIASRGSGKGIEGPGILYQDGFYFLFTSWDLCCQGASSTYKIAVGRSPTIDGDYVDRTGTSLKAGGGTILVDAGVDPRWVASGGQFGFFHEGRWRLAYHSYDAFNNGMATLRIANLSFQGGWPSLETAYPGFYRLKNLGSGTYLDSLGGAEGARVAQGTASTSVHQQWSLVEAGNGTLNLVNRTGNLAVNSAASLAAGSVSAALQWTLAASGSGYRVVNAGRCLDTLGRTAGALVAMMPPSEAVSQIWSLEAVP